MAPSLKEIDAADPAGGSVGRGTVAHPSIPAVVSSSSDNSNDAPPVAVSSPAAQKMPPIPQVEREDPTNVPDDQTAFLVAPHFSRNNPFHRDLSAFDLSMRCSICKDIFQNPVSLMPCLHNFCSLCVRDHLKRTSTGMKRKADCPQCNAPVTFPGSSNYEKGILPNKPLEAQVDAYKKCRGGLRESLVSLDVLQKEKEMGILTQLDGASELGRKRGSGGRGGRSSKRARRAVSKDGSYASGSDGDSDEELDDDDEDYDDDDSSDSKMTPASSGHAVANTKVVLKHKATVSYHGLNKKKLALLCQKEGLESHGNEGELKKRHSDFITLYNSECDSAHPRSEEELRKVIRTRERAIEREAKDAKQKKESKHMKSLGSSLDAYHEGSVSKPTSGNQKFDTMMNNNFARMIADVKKREGKSEDAAAGKSNGDAEVPECVKKCTAVASTQQLEGAAKASGINGGDSSPTASLDSDGTVETPKKPPAKKSAAPKSKPAATKRQPSAKKSKSSNANTAATENTPRVTRLSGLGPWTCQTCTYINQRNVTKKAFCEMCGGARPEEVGGDEDVIEIDC